MTTRSSLLPATHNKTKADDRIAKTLRFDVEAADLVAMTISDTSRYELSEAGKLDYSRLMPTGGHTVHISTPNESVPRTYTVALFHQLKCLEIYHRNILSPYPMKSLRNCEGVLIPPPDTYVPCGYTIGVDKEWGSPGIKTIRHCMSGLDEGL
ncbi:hypothetical protein CPB84DRAFT_827121 [Gymnopilus junonius]|uniref:Uncharacterized protein n=1 Tax=Gymnopilus junonius TaxID=109634 RepID=A0A9P5N9C7_GYMJU|nr:hypothetical protein CPB84DRAFT_827121 [Gymnopilus junonius]